MDVDYIEEVISIRNILKFFVVQEDLGEKEELLAKCLLVCKIVSNTNN